MPTVPLCPHCDEPLELLDPPPSGTPPWWSPGCARLWWDAELTAAGRSTWERSNGGHRKQGQDSVKVRVAAGLEAAKARAERGRGRRR